MRPFTIQTLESIQTRCILEGDCWLWTGGLDGHGRPQCKHQGKVWYVRRLARELTDGKPLQRNLVVACECGQKLCVSPHCSVAVSSKTRARMAVARGSYSRPDKIAKSTMAIRAKSRFSEDLIQRVRTMPPPCTAISAETGISLSHVKSIRRGTARVPFSNPFAGLGAR